jgi:hypothetical protein
MIDGAPINVLDYGAVGDGVTNDAAAIQAAVNAGTTVYFPAGTYLINTAISVPSATTLYGENKVNTKIKAGAAINMLSVASVNYNVRIRRLTLDGDSLAARAISSVAATNGASAHMLIEDVEVANCTDKGIYLKFMAYATLKDVYVSNVAANTSAYGLYLENAANCEIQGGLYYNSKLGSIYLASCYFNRFLNTRLFNDSIVSSPNLLDVNGSYGNNFEGLTFEPQGAANVTNNVLLEDTVAGNCTDNTFRDCSFIGVNGTATNIIEINSAFKTQIIGCRFIAQAAASILLTSQASTSIANCCDNVTYDTPVFSNVTITNNSGNSYFFEALAGTFGNLTPSTDGNINNGNASLRWNNVFAKTGFVVTTPDGTKNYRIAVDNAGAVTTTLV